MTYEDYAAAMNARIEANRKIDEVQEFIKDKIVKIINIYLSKVKNKDVYISFKKIGKIIIHVQIGIYRLYDNHSHINFYDKYKNGNMRIRTKLIFDDKLFKQYLQEIKVELL